MKSVDYAPGVTTIRTVKDNDAALPATKIGGVNCAEYDEVILGVVLQNSATKVTIQAYAWSPAAAAFLPYLPVLSYTGGQARMRFAVERADSVFFEITAITGGVNTDDRVVLELSGAPSYNRVG